MKKITIQLLNPKVINLLNTLEELGLIKIVDEKSSSILKSLSVTKSVKRF